MTTKIADQNNSNSTFLSKVWLIAWAHFTAILKAKAFWMGVLMAPLIMVLVVVVMRFAESSQPTRTFVLIDKTARYDEALDQYLNRAYARRVMEGYVQFFSRNSVENWRSRANSESLDVQMAAGFLDNYLADDKAEGINLILAEGAISEFIGLLKPLLRQDAPEYELPRRRALRVSVPDEVNVNASVDTLVEQLRPYLTGDKKAQANGRNYGIYAAVIIEDGVVKNDQSVPVVNYWSTNLTNNTLPSIFQTVVDQQLRQQMLLASGIDQTTLTSIENAEANLLQFDPKKAKGDEGRTLADRLSVVVPVIFAVALFMILIISTSILLQSIIEEKSNKLIEVLLSSVTPGQLMAGKLVGVAAISLASIAVWIVLGLIAAYFGFSATGAVASAGSEVASTANLSAEQIEAIVVAAATALKMLPIFIFCFLCGYVIYASLFLAIGSLCSSPQDANTLITPLMMLMMVPMFLVSVFVTDPNGVIATTMTWIPLYTPFAIVVRMSADPPMFEIITSSLIMLAMTFVSVWVSLKIFRYGVLYSGETPKMLQVIRLAVARKPIT